MNDYECPHRAWKDSIASVSYSCPRCLEAENQRLQMIIKAIKEWATVDFNKSLLGFIQETEACKLAEEIEKKLKGEK
jgi:hypothetical protein